VTEFPQLEPRLATCLEEMHRLYSADPMKAVRGQSFIKTLHHYIAEDLKDRLHPKAIKSGVQVIEEAEVFGSHKPKDVDVGIIHPRSGPLVLVGVRSQMSSVGKNVLTYYQDIVGECISLQERYPMTAFAYAYLHPMRYRDEKKNVEIETNYRRYARLYASISGRDDVMYRQLKGIYDQFAYMLVDFQTVPISLRDDLIANSTDRDLRITTFVDRIVETVKQRTVWLDLFK
jgi:hypothetical protein